MAEQTGQVQHLVSVGLRRHFQLMPLEAGAPRGLCGIQGHELPDGRADPGWDTCALARGEGTEPGGRADVAPG